MKIFMVIVAEGDGDTVTYHENSEQAAVAAGYEKWELAQPAFAIRRLEVGDEINLTPYASVIRVTGKVTDYHA